MHSLYRCRLTAAALAFVGALAVYPAQGAQGAPGRAVSTPLPLEVIVLGSGGPAALGRASSSYLVLLDGAARIMVDAGPGSFARLGEAHVSFAALDTVLLTHLHVDHAAELPGIVKARAVSSAQPIAFQILARAVILQGRRVRRFPQPAGSSNCSSELRGRSPT